MKTKAGKGEHHQLNGPHPSLTSNSEVDGCDPNEVHQPQPSPAESEDLSGTGVICVNTPDDGIGIDDFKVDENFLARFDPSVQCKLKMIAAAHENAKKYLDVTVNALNSQKQYLKYMSDQNKDYHSKLEVLESELKQEQELKEKAEENIRIWKTECKRSEAIFNKIKNKKKQIQVELAKMYERYGALMAENHSLRRMVETLSSGYEEPRISCLPARKPRQSLQKVGNTDTNRISSVGLPPITSPRGQAGGRSKRKVRSSLPPIIPSTSRREEDKSDQFDSTSLKPPTPWYKTSEKSPMNSPGRH